MSEPSDHQMPLTRLLVQAESNLREGNPQQALRKFYEAWTLLEKPRTEQQQAAGILEGIGDCYRETGKYEPSNEAFTSSLFCVNPINRASIHLKIALNLIALEQESRATEHLAQAYRFGGREVFSNSAPRLLMLAMENQKPQPPVTPSK